MGGIFLSAEDLCLVDVPLGRNPLPHHPVEVGDHQIAQMLLHGLDQQLGGIGGDPVVGVQELEIPAPRLVKTQVPAIRNARIFFVKYPDPAVCGGVFVADPAGAVPATVIGQKQLKIGVLLIQNALHTAAKAGFGVVDWNNDADRWIHDRPPR